MNTNPMTCSHAGENWFDRTICQEPCGMMHTRCADCGEALGHGCHWERKGFLRRQERDRLGTRAVLTDLRIWVSCQEMRTRPETILQGRLLAEIDRMYERTL